MFVFIYFHFFFCLFGYDFLFPRGIIFVDGSLLHEVKSIFFLFFCSFVLHCISLCELCMIVLFYFSHFVPFLLNLFLSFFSLSPFKYYVIPPPPSLLKDFEIMRDHIGISFYLFLFSCGILKVK